MKKRFIAGAVCPSCSELDKVVMYDEHGDRFRECVACGFKEQLEQDPAMLEPETRVNKGMVRQVDALQKRQEEKDQVQVVELIDLENNKTLH